MSRWEGFYGIIKPKGPTSHDIVDRLREITGVKKIGHAGTLDPMAEGVLVVAIGRRFTRDISKYRKAEKEYEAKIELGKKSDTDDAEGEVKETEPEKIPTKEEIERELLKFKGLITQKPPIYSAVKINGTPSYKLARQGKNPSPPPRRVEVKDIKLKGYEYPFVDAWIKTGSGVYIRSIARDLGENLSTGGVLTELTRTRVGEFELKNSQSLKSFKK